MTLKEMSIREYISKIDFKNDDWKLSKIKEDMRRFLGEEPGIDVIYKKDVMINETTQQPIEFVDVDKIEIVYFDTDERFKKIQILLNERV
jgi:hypothetical protein